MNGFKMLADDYRKYLNTHDKMTPEAREGMENSIKALDTAATLNDEQRLALFDTGIFNDVLKAYCEAALRMSDNVNRDTANEVLSNVRWLLDTRSAGEILK